MPKPFKKQIHKTCKAMGGGRFPGTPKMTQ